MYLLFILVSIFSAMIVISVIKKDMTVILI